MASELLVTAPLRQCIIAGHGHSLPTEGTVVVHHNAAKTQRFVAYLCRRRWRALPLASAAHQRYREVRHFVVPRARRTCRGTPSQSSRCSGSSTSPVIRTTATPRSKSRHASTRPQAQHFGRFSFGLLIASPPCVWSMYADTRLV